ncbi:MAG: acyl-CoA thioesterase, partial [Nevskiales bacterium]
MVEIKWDYPNPFEIKIQVSQDDIDVLGHSNNVSYLRWLEQAG